MQIELHVSSALSAYVTEKYSDLKMGARPLKRAIQTFIEDPLAEEILSGKVKQGDTVTAGIRDGKAVFTLKKMKRRK
jgi:ATP-dependent Clp protease ATP-binding subunit ClpC